VIKKRTNDKKENEGYKQRRTSLLVGVLTILCMIFLAVGTGLIMSYREIGEIDQVNAFNKAQIGTLTAKVENVDIKIEKVDSSVNFLTTDVRVLTSEVKGLARAINKLTKIGQKNFNSVVRLENRSSDYAY